MLQLPDKFQFFKQDVRNYALPQQFNYPFYYEPHPLCRIAAKELQAYLQNQQDWKHDFDALGKMFGVLLVEAEDGTLGYLAAFSGKLANSNNWPVFVPPIFDMLDEDGFYRKGEEELNQLNRQIEKLETAADLEAAQKLLEAEQALASYCLTRQKERLKAAKQARKLKRAEAQQVLSTEAYEALVHQLKKESIAQQYQFKRLKRHWKLRLAAKTQPLDQLEQALATLKTLRQQKSAALQERLFDQYQLLNGRGVPKGVAEIFAATVLEQPPSGAGECAAPKLLQYAFQHQLKPLAMAEFWWGTAPNSQVRQHGQFYPACRAKCEPILGHMLEGIKVAPNPMLQNSAEGKLLEIIYEDEQLLVLHKPEGILSVPGRHIQDSVYSRMRKRYPKAKGPLIVHRLDMSTSGLMLIAKDEATHKHLQQQFIKRKIKKRYVALLDGWVEGEEGVIDLPLMADYNERPRQMVSFEQGKAARTFWKVLAKTHHQTRIHFFPVTGRTHQLRVHAAHALGLNCPIVGDDLYGKRDTRLHLHAEAIEFEQPLTKEWLQFELEAAF